MSGVFNTLFCLSYMLCLQLTLVTSAPCLCQNPAWCKPISTPMPNKEVFIFVVSMENWKLYDWSRITTVAAFKPVDPELLCYAHSQGVRVVYGADFPKGNLTNVGDRHKWVGEQVEKIQTEHLDGVNVDFEDSIAPTDVAKRDGLTLLMMELYSKLKAINPNYQITFDTPYYPETTYRAFEYLNMSRAVDFYFVMDYDMSGTNRAYANCPINTVKYGIQDFITKGIPASKLVLGVPWYGYNYPCTKIVGKQCHIKEVPFRGVNCSDAAGSQINYSGIVKDYIPRAIGGVQWDTSSETPFFTYQDSESGLSHQIWFDNPNSLEYKYKYAVAQNLRGVGMWTADSVDYSNTTAAAEQRKQMWSILPKKESLLRL